MSQASTTADTAQGQDPRPLEADRPGSPGPWRERRGLLVLALSLVVVFGFVRPFVVEPFYMPLGSMSPTLRPGDSVLAAKFAYPSGTTPAPRPYGEPRQAEGAIL